MLYVWQHKVSKKYLVVSEQSTHTGHHMTCRDTIYMQDATVAEYIYWNHPKMSARREDYEQIQVVRIIQRVNPI